MKPYITIVVGKNFCPCCPGHDGADCVNKWGGTYKGRASKKAQTKVRRLQARRVRRTLKNALRGEEHE